MSDEQPEEPATATAEIVAAADAHDAEHQLAPRWLLALELGYVVALVALAILYGQLKGLRELIPDPAGPIPLGVPWWGALGGITISLTGIFRNRQRWDASLNSWHISRPVLGAIMGSVGYLIFITVIRSTGTTVSTNAASGRAVFFLVAFLLGYREEAFRNLLRRAVDLLLTSGTKTENEKS